MHIVQKPKSSNKNTYHKPNNQHVSNKDMLASRRGPLVGSMLVDRKIIKSTNEVKPLVGFDWELSPFGGDSDSF